MPKHSAVKRSKTDDDKFTATKWGGSDSEGDDVSMEDGDEVDLDDFEDVVVAMLDEHGALLRELLTKFTELKQSLSK